MEHARARQHRSRHHLDSVYQQDLGHLIQAFFVRGGLLQGVRRRCCQLRAICRMPLLVLLSLGPVRFARAVGGHIEVLYLVDIVVIHAPLGEDILAPRTELPITAVVSAGSETLWHSSKFAVSTPTAVLVMTSRWPKKPYCT